MSRKTNTRDPKNNIVIVVEGHSEEAYLSHLKERDANMEIFIKRSKGRDPMHMVKYCIEKMKDKEISIKNGDLAYCVFDVDQNTKEQMIQAQKEADKRGIKLILSNPFFEVWFLMHFKDISYAIAPEEIHSELKRSIGSYKKGEDI